MDDQGKAQPARRAGERAFAWFRSAFGLEPEVVARAPGRVNLIGEHIDYHGGSVLPIAIDRDCVVCASRADRSEILAIDASDALIGRWTPGDSSRVDDLPAGAWQRYVGGVIHTLREELRGAGGSPPEHVRFTIASDVPLGAGLSSSAALEVAVARCFGALSGVTIDGVRIARACRRAEHEFAGVPCGIMDQLASAMAVGGHALLIDCATERCDPVPLPTPERLEWVVVNTGVKHSLAAGEYARRVTITRRAAAMLGVSHLALAGVAAVERARGALDEETYRAAGHVVHEQHRVREAVERLRSNELDAFGTLMVRSHESLRDDYRVSCEELDAAVGASLATPGVYGARMTGAGFGGCVIVAAKPGTRDALRERVVRAFLARFHVTPDVFDVRPSAGASLIAPRA